jgi:hypothetical protein
MAKTPDGVSRVSCRGHGLATAAAPCVTGRRVAALAQASDRVMRDPFDMLTRVSRQGSSARSRPPPQPRRSVRRAWPKWRTRGFDAVCPCVLQYATTLVDAKSILLRNPVHAPSCAGSVWPAMRKGSNLRYIIHVASRGSQLAPSIRTASTGCPGGPRHPRRQTQRACQWLG